MSIPTDYNPLGTTIQKGMWIDKGVLKGNLFSTYANTSITSVDARCDASGIVDGSYMFYKCTKISEWGVDLPNLTNGSYMFYNCTGLTEWSAELPNLITGDYMFRFCTGIKRFEIDLPNLESGQFMFECNYKYKGFEYVSSDMRNLTNGSYMFRDTGLKEFHGNLNSLQRGEAMFSYSKLNIFDASLPKLNDAFGMFSRDCTLNEESVWRVLSSLPAYTEGQHRISLGKTTNWLNSNRIAEWLGTTVPIANATYNSHGWTVIIPGN